MVHQCCQSCPSQKASLPSPLKIHTNKLIPFFFYPLLPHSSSFLPPHFLFIVPNVKQKQDVLNQVSLSPVGSACCVVSVSADCMHILSTNITWPRSYRCRWSVTQPGEKAMGLLSSVLVCTHHIAVSGEAVGVCVCTLTWHNITFLYSAMWLLHVLLCIFFVYIYLSLHSF